MKYTGRFSINAGQTAGVYSSNNKNQLIKDLRNIALAYSSNNLMDRIFIEIKNEDGEVIVFLRKDRFSRKFFIIY